MKVSRHTWIGFALGFGGGMGDYLLLRALDVSMFANESDVTFAVVLFFALNFGALGAVIARLWEREKSLSAMQEQLVEAQTLAAVGQMAAGVAHEVRNPLSTIRSSAQLLEDDLDEKSGAVAGFIKDEVDRLDGFVTRVLDFSKPLEATVTSVPVRELEARVDAAAAGVAWDIDVETLEVDAELTVQVLSNLVENARRAEAQRVEIHAGKDVIEVRDDGNGVASDVAGRLFEPFFTTRPSGTGLGLAMAKKLTKVQGWDIEFGGPGLSSKGACFRLRRVAA